MAARLLFLLLVLLFGTLQAYDKNISHRILYLIQTGHLNDGLDLYKSYAKELGHHDQELLREISFLLLDQGARSNDPETQLMAIFGAGISLSEKALHILEAGVEHQLPQIQLVSLNFLSKYHNDLADELLKRGMIAQHPLIRLETVFLMAEKKLPTALAHAESLMYKFEKEVWPIFTEIYAMIGSNAAVKLMRKMLASTDSKIRLAMVHNAAEYGRDDLLPQIRTLAAQHDLALQEACAYALGELGDHSSIPRLKELAVSKSANVKLASLIALYKLGIKETANEIQAMASAGDLFAIAALGQIPNSEVTLLPQLLSKNIQIKINAAIALLELEDSRCIMGLEDLLVRDHRDLIFGKTSSIGRSLQAIKAIPSGTENLQDNPLLYELSLHLKEAIVEKAKDLPEKQFLDIADALLSLQENELVPILVELLEEKRSDKAIRILKKYQQMLGAPLIRNYCNLALYRLKEEGPHAEILQEWVGKKQNESLIKFRPFVPAELRKRSEGSYQLTPEETSRLLIETFETFVRMKDTKGIDVLIEAIQNGNSKNRYALAGLLIHASN